MLDKDKLEKSLLLCVVNYKQSDVLLKNGITRDFFSVANYKLYDYINEFLILNKYPDVRVVANVFGINDFQLQEYLASKDSLDEICGVLHDEYVRNQLRYKIGKLNEYQDEMYNDPNKYIDRLALVVDELKGISYNTKSVGLFDEIENILDIDSSDVISTGFRELDKKLVGWKCGEELVVFVGRTGQGKSWLCLKFAMAAALAGERVGIYSGEMSQQQLQERIICCAKETTTTTNEEALQFIKNSNIDIRLLTQRELRRRATVRDIEEFIVKDKLTMVVIDQLSLMDDVIMKPRSTVATNLWKYNYGFVYSF